MAKAKPTTTPSPLPTEGEHFEEGLLHLADMLEISDPRRPKAAGSGAKISGSGLAVPIGATFEEWKAFCLDVCRSLQVTRAKVKTPAAHAMIDAAIARIEQLVE